jgi:hypothetical protein
MDVKCDIKELLQRDERRARCEEHLESLIQDLRHTTPDMGISDKEIA